ncbi:MAG: hypothetical protein AB8V53_04695 [Arsenophonus endosymbiont of Dermacentor nuttalli]
MIVFYLSYQTANVIVTNITILHLNITYLVAINSTDKNNQYSQFVIDQ